MQMLLRSFCRELPHSFGFYKNGIHQKLQVPQIEVLTLSAVRQASVSETLAVRQFLVPETFGE